MANKKVTPLSPKRNKGRPSRVQQQIINLERKIFATREKIIDVQPEAIEVIYELMRNKDAPPQVRLSSARDILGYGAALYEELIAQDQQLEDDSIEPSDTLDQETEEEKGIVVSFGGNN